MTSDCLLLSTNDWLNTLCHYGRKGQHWRQHDPNRRWQRAAVYANGRPDPNSNKLFEAYASTVSGRKLLVNSNEIDRLRSDYDKHVQDYMNNAIGRMNSLHGNPERFYKVTNGMLNKHPVEKLSELKRLDGSLTQAQVRMNINHPGDEHVSAGRHFNCQNCAVAFEMAERGYDVVARIKRDGSNVENIADNFIGGKLTPVLPNDNPFSITSKYGKVSDETISKEYGKAIKLVGETLSKTIKQQGNGARGIIVEGYTASNDPSVRTSSYHAYNYKVEGNKIRYYDVQSRNRKDQNGGAEVDVRWIDPRELYFMRTDNLELSPSCTNSVYSRR